jgi:hypothetical protein
MRCRGGKIAVCGTLVAVDRDNDRLNAYLSVGWSETTDQLRTTPAELSARQRSTVDASEQWFTLDNRPGPIWGSRGREFKSRQPD